MESKAGFRRFALVPKLCNGRPIDLDRSGLFRIWEILARTVQAGETAYFSMKFSLPLVEDRGEGISAPL